MACHYLSRLDIRWVKKLSRESLVLVPFYAEIWKNWMDSYLKGTLKIFRGCAIPADMHCCRYENMISLSLIESTFF